LQLSAVRGAVKNQAHTSKAVSAFFMSVHTVCTQLIEMALFFKNEKRIEIINLEAYYISNM